MAVAENAYNAFAGYRHIKPGQGAEWVESNPAAWEIICRVNGWTPEMFHPIKRSKEKLN